MWGGAPHPVKGSFFTPTPTLPRGEGVKNDSGDLRSPGPRPGSKPLDPSKKVRFWGSSIPRPQTKGFALRIPAQGFHPFAGEGLHVGPQGVFYFLTLG